MKSMFMVRPSLLLTMCDVPFVLSPLTTSTAVVPSIIVFLPSLAVSSQ